jgi:hypothetical protein
MFFSVPVNYGNSYAALRKSRCSLCLSKIGLVQIDGDYGSRIQDDIRIYTDDQNQQPITITFDEETTHQLHIQLDCGGYFDRDSTDTPCSRFLSVHVWIDFNDNRFDDGESRSVPQSWSSNDVPTGKYDLQLYIPTIDERNTKSGPHLMRITVMLSDEYQRGCGTLDYKETREYTANIVSKKREGKYCSLY